MEGSKRICEGSRDVSIPPTPFLSSQKIKEITEYFQNNGYDRSWKTEIYTKHLGSRTPGFIQLQLRFVVFGQANKRNIICEMKFFRVLGGLRDHIHVQKDISSLEDVKRLENSWNDMEDIARRFNLSV